MWAPSLFPRASTAAIASGWPRQALYRLARAVEVRDGTTEHGGQPVAADVPGALDGLVGHGGGHELDGAAGALNRQVQLIEVREGRDVVGRLVRHRGTLLLWMVDPASVTAPESDRRPSKPPLPISRGRQPRGPRSVSLTVRLAPEVQFL